MTAATLYDGIIIIFILKISKQEHWRLKWLAQGYPQHVSGEAVEAKVRN